MGARSDRKSRSREKILESAGVLMREKGISGASVANVMGGAGMTVGGFYAHFPSKDELVAETLRAALRESRGRLSGVAGEKRGADWIDAVARSYLSRAHRDVPQAGCPLPATMGELAGAGTGLREVLAEELDSTFEEMESRLRDEGAEDPRGEAMATLATMVGGLALSRASRGTPLSDEMLKACRAHIARCSRG